MKLIPLPAFQDNDLWFLQDGHRTLVVDPGDARPVIAALQSEHLKLDAILVTHLHPDCEDFDGAPLVFCGDTLSRPAAGAWSKARRRRCCSRWKSWQPSPGKPVFAAHMNTL